MSKGDSWERAYSRFLRMAVQTGAALLGLYIMFKAISEGGEKPWLYAAAIMMMGLPGARGFEQLVSSIGRIMDALRSVESHGDDSDEPSKQPEHSHGKPGEHSTRPNRGG